MFVTEYSTPADQRSLREANEAYNIFLYQDFVSIDALIKVGYNFCGSMTYSILTTNHFSLVFSMSPKEQELSPSLNTLLYPSYLANIPIPF